MHMRHELICVCVCMRESVCACAVQLRAPSLRLCRDVFAAQASLGALRPVVVQYRLRGGVGQRGADVRAAHSSKHCGPEHLPRPDEHVRGPPHAHTWPVRAVLGSLLWPSCVLFRICPPRARFACVCAVCMCVVCARARAHVCMCICMCVCVRVCARAHTHTYSHTTLEGRDLRVIRSALLLRDIAMRAKGYL